MNRQTRATTLLQVAAILAATVSMTGCGGTSGSATTSSATAATSTTPTTPPASTATPPATTSSDPITLSASTYSVAQGTATAAITVVRTGSSTDPVSVDYSTADGTAVAGTDYTATNGTLTWAPNDSTAKTVSVPVSSTTPFTGDKTFTLVLNNPSAEAMIGSPGAGTITISGAAAPTVG